MTIIKRIRHGANVETIALTDIELWKQHAGPKHVDRQWIDLASAKEAARAWIEAAPSLPTEVAAMLRTHHAIGFVREWIAEPEVRLPFDRMGEARNSDLLVRVRDGKGPFLIAVEAKAAESFGSSIAATRRAAEARLTKSKGNPRPSRGVERVDALCATYLGATLAQDPSLGSLSYQLLTATAGAVQIALNEGVTRSVLLIQEFVSRRTPVKVRARNSKALDAFVERFTRGAVRSIPTGCLIHIPLPHAVWSEKATQFYIAKVEHPLRPAPPST